MPNTAKIQPQSTSTLRHDWTLEEALALYHLPFNDLLFQAHLTHRTHFPPNEVQVSTLLSIKTGGCAEDCAYCPQSSHYHTGLKAEKLMQVDAVLEEARKAKAAGASRFCMGAAWREPKDRDMPKLTAMIEGVKALGLESCMTLGMLQDHQAQQLKDAGLDYYNHNLDTSEEFYSEIITTRTYQDRLDTLERVRNVGMKTCCGGIVGMGESEKDRAAMLVTLANLPTHPESVPINQLVEVEGTPLARKEEVSASRFQESNTPALPLPLKGEGSVGTANAGGGENKNLAFIRTIAVARIMMPQSYVRLSAGRETMSDEMQALCYFAGANSIFYGEKLLTTPNPAENKDMQLFAELGIKAV